MHQKRRVVITGTGMVTPLGHNTEDTWRAILAGTSGLGPITQFAPDGHTSGGVCEVKAFDAAAYLGRRDARRRDRNQQFASVAANEAIKQAGLEIDDSNRERIGIYMGTGVGGIRSLVESERIYLEKGPTRISPLAITMIMPNGAGGMIGIDHGIHGPNTTVATACASGCDAIGHAFRAIQHGEIDVAITGGTESVMTSVSVGGFEVAKSTSSRPSQTPRPFDKERDGLIAGEGAGVLILESLESALARNAPILAEVVGYGQTADAYHITAPTPGGLGAARAIRKALADAGVQPEEVSYISAHGTGTELNDAAETAAIKAVMGEAAYAIPVSSTKSMTGHIMGATGAIEAIFCTLAIRDQIVPPTINYETPDPECDLDYVPNEARRVAVDVCLDNAFGFGGHNAVLVFRKYKA
jgi:3-oxoacyl-[acyl-carrier-protein] synthase II